jgi:hypothetical protein
MVLFPAGWKTPPFTDHAQCLHVEIEMNLTSSAPLEIASLKARSRTGALSPP